MRAMTRRTRSLLSCSAALIAPTVPIDATSALAEQPPGDVVPALGATEEARAVQRELGEEREEQRAVVAAEQRALVPAVRHLLRLRRVVLPAQDVLAGAPD